MTLTNEDPGKPFSQMTLDLVIGFHGWYKLTHGAGWFLEIQAMLLFCTPALFFTGSGIHALSSTGKWD